MNFTYKVCITGQKRDYYNQSWSIMCAWTIPLKGLHLPLKINAF